MLLCICCTCLSGIEHVNECRLHGHCMHSRTIAGHESWVLSLAVHPEGSVFVSGSSDAKLKLWDTRASHGCLQTVADHTDQARAAG